MLLRSQVDGNGTWSDRREVGSQGLEWDAAEGLINPDTVLPLTPPLPQPKNGVLGSG